MIPVEKMAARLLSRHKLEPPYDLIKLVEHYATVEFCHFPVDADGITIGIGGEKEPQILINSSAPETRKKFTLAHELGHVKIPWHTGTIVSHLDPIEASLEYSEMEAEANKFAAELLIPTSWLREQEQRFVNVESFIKKVIADSGVSRDAALIKIFNIINVPIVCSQIDDGSNIINSFRSGSAPRSAMLDGRNVNDEEIFTTASSEELFTLGDRLYKSWVFTGNKINETDPRTWREVIKQILIETDSQNLLASINAVLPNQYLSHKNKPESEICAIAMQAYDGRGKYDHIISHPLFSQYVVKRVKELIAKNKT